MVPGIHLGDLATVGLLAVLEAVLSADNALVIAVVILGLPRGQHRRALSYGLVGSFVLRTIATALAVYLIRLAWVKLAGGGYLLYLAAQHFLSHHGSGERRIQPAKAWLGLSPFWATVVRVELINLAFSIDSILVAVAMSSVFWVVLSGGILGILAIRFIVGAVVRLLERYPPLIDGAFVVIGWVATKLVLDYAHQMRWVGWEVPQTVSLALVSLILLGAYVLARRRGAQPVSEEAAKVDVTTWPEDD